MKGGEGWPDGRDHKPDTLSSNPSLDSVPDTGHDSSVQDRPKGTPDSEAGTGYDGERDVVCRPNPSSDHNKASRNSITKPDAKP